MTITATQVNELRQRTGISMMACKKALEEANGVKNRAAKLLGVRTSALYYKLEKFGLLK